MKTFQVLRSSLSISKCLCKTLIVIYATVACTFSAVAAEPSSSQAYSPDPARVAKVAQWLPEQPRGFGAPCSNRAAWTAVASHYQGAIAKAEDLLQRPIAPWSNDAYLQFSRTGDRQRGEAMLSARNSPLTPLVLAECAEGQGRFLPRIAEELDAISAEPSWTLPAHDAKLENFRGTHPGIDLNAATLGHEVAQAIYLLGARLPAATRKRAMEALELHVFHPFEQTLAGKDKQWWLDATNNWNAVCLDGVAGAAMAVIPDRKRRALIAAAAEHDQAYYLSSFRDSGYADEGIGYWSYGFSHYTDLRDVLWFATDGRVDLFENAKAQRAARFGFEFAMFPGVYADLGDAHFMTLPDPVLLARLSSIFGWQLPEDQKADARAFNDDLVTAVLAGFPVHSERRHQAATPQLSATARTYYADVGVLVARPAPSAARLAITIKAGGNTNHSHNDVGAYSIAIGPTQIVGDPGGPLFYTADVFNSKRYRSPLLNSFGHPVPSINGSLQLDATKVTPRVVSTNFTPERDSIAIDMTPAYRQPALRALVRTMHYSRHGDGSIEIEDHFDLAAAADIVESFPTHGTWRRIDANTLQFDDENAHLQVKIDAPGNMTFTDDPITDYGEKVRRIGAHIHLERSGVITMRFQPVSSSAASTAARK